MERENKIAYLFTGGRKERLEAIKKGESPEDFFYGGLELQRRGFDIDFLEESDFVSPPYSLTVRAMQHISSRWRSLDRFALARLGQQDSVVKLDKYRAIIATNNSDGMALAYLKKEGRIFSQVIFLSMCPLFPEDFFLKKLQFKRLLPGIILGVENTNEIDFLKRQYPDLNLKIEYTPFGVDKNFWKPANVVAEIPYVLSIGNDAMRDFDTLVRAWKPSFPLLKIITRRPLSENLPKNIEVVRGDWHGQYLSDEEIRVNMQKSLFVVVPAKESLRSSGPSVSMQAMGCEKAVIISNTKGLWAPQILKDGINCFLVEPENHEALQAKIEILLSDKRKRDQVAKKGHITMLEHFTVQNVADHIEKLLAYANIIR